MTPPFAGLRVRRILLLPLLHLCSQRFWIVNNAGIRLKCFTAMEFAITSGQTG
jgi:hypothetical protein